MHNYGEGKLESLQDTGGHTHSQTQFHIVCTCMYLYNLLFKALATMNGLILRVKCICY